jgi:putative methionine-R-sulfoxide reductase with GAF domain
VCAPIYRGDERIGIIDVEAWKKDHFSDDRVAVVLDVCEQLGKMDLLR